MDESEKMDHLEELDWFEKLEDRSHLADHKAVVILAARLCRWTMRKRHWWLVVMVDEPLVAARMACECSNMLHCQDKAEQWSSIDH